MLTKKTKIIFFIFFLLILLFLPACSKRKDIQLFLSKICLDLDLQCQTIEADNIGWYSEKGIISYASYSTNVSGGFEIQNQIISYFESKHWKVDLYNMADGMEGSLVGYTNDNLYCHILGSWELDQGFELIGSGNVYINCFKKQKP